MSDPVTVNIGLATPVRGTDAGTWDVPINGDMTILDTCAGSVTSKSLSNSNVTLTTAEAQVAILRFSGVLSSNVTITVSAVIKSWVCENTCTGAFVVKIAGSAGNVVALPPGSCQVYWDGSNVSFLNLGKVGEFWDYIGSSVPAWVTNCTVPPYLLCDGSTFSAVTYPLLNSILSGTTLPDSRNRARYTVSSVGRITTAGSGIDGATNLSAGGAQNIAISQANLPDVALPVTDPGHFHPIKKDNLYAGGSNGALNGAGVLSANSDSAVTNISVRTGGSGTALNEMPPAYVAGITLVRAA